MIRVVECEIVRSGVYWGAWGVRLSRVRTGLGIRLEKWGCNGVYKTHLTECMCWGFARYGVVWDIVYWGFV